MAGLRRHGAKSTKVTLSIHKGIFMSQRKIGISSNLKNLDLLNYAAIDLLEKLQIMTPSETQIELVENLLNTITNNNANDIANLCKKLGENSIHLKLTRKQIEQHFNRTLPTSQYPCKSKKLSIDVRC